MKISSLVLPFLFTYSCLAHEFFKLSSPNPLQKRTSCGRGDTCQEACGGGAIPCGTSGNHCYDPTLGESCCTADEHYCLKGQYCAPVVGYCCNDSETPSSCASRLSFTLPLATATLFTSESATPASTSTVAPVYSTSSSKPSSTSVRATSSSPKASSSQIQALSTTKSVPTSASSSISASSTTSKASSVAATTTTRTVSVTAFTGAAMKDSAPGAIFMGAAYLLAAL